MVTRLDQTGQIYNQMEPVDDGQYVDYEDFAKVELERDEARVNAIKECIAAINEASAHGSGVSAQDVLTALLTRPAKNTGASQ
jgi:hypothetical protein